MLILKYCCCVFRVWILRVIWLHIWQDSLLTFISHFAIIFSKYFQQVYCWFTWHCIENWDEIIYILLLLIWSTERPMVTALELSQTVCCWQSETDVMTCGHVVREATEKPSIVMWRWETGGCGLCGYDSIHYQRLEAALVILWSFYQLFMPALTKWAFFHSFLLQTKSVMDDESF